MPVSLTNDYLFRALLQSNNRVLKSLICSLLYLDSSEVESVEIKNPIDLGRSINDKTFFLDIKVLLNNHTFINLEMQVINERNWVNRSLSYLCRTYDNLEHGEDYINAKPAVQIGLLDFTLFPDSPKFYSIYKMLDVETHRLYSDNLRICVLDLTQIALATEEDKAHDIDKWAKFFKAKTWEEVKMIADKNPEIKEASSTIKQLTDEERIRYECEAREDYYRRERSKQILHEQALKDLDEARTERDEAVAERDEAVAECDRLKKLLLEAGIDPNQ